MSVAAAVPQPAASTPSAKGAGDAATTPQATGAAGATVTISSFADLIALLQQDQPADPAVAGVDASGNNANPATATPAADAQATTPQALSSVAVIAAAADTLAAGIKADAKAGDATADKADDKDNAPAAAADADPNQMALIASLLAAQAPVLTPQTATPAKTVADPLLAPATKGPAAPQPADADANAQPAVDPKAAAAFDNALAAATGAKTTPQGQGSDKAADQQPGSIAPTAAKAAPAKADATADQTLARAATHINSDTSTQSSGFSVQTAQASTPSTYTAQAAPAHPAIQADAAPAAAPAAQPATTMSQTAVQTLSALSVQISKRLDDGNTKFNVELHPADLGRVDVALTIDRDGKVNAHLNFDTPMTATSFAAHEGELRQSLSQAGLNVDSGSLTFSSRGDDSSQSGSNNAFLNQQQQNQQQPNPQHAARALAATAQGNDAADLDLNTLSNLSAAPSTLALNLIV